MKRITNLWLGMIFVLSLAMSSLAQTSTTATTTAQASAGTTTAQPSTADQQPLGDYARSVRKEKNQAVKSFDNDNLPMEDKLSVVGATPASDEHPAANPAIAGNGGDASTADKADPKKLPTVTPGESMEDRQKKYGQWQDKLSEQKGKVDLLSHDIDALQREYKLRLAEVYYGDPAARARNDVGADKQAADFKKELDEKQRALNDAKQDLDGLQEDARKAGVPESVRENVPEEQK
jgi:hypothetical protein